VSFREAEFEDGTRGLIFEPGPGPFEQRCANVAASRAAVQHLATAAVYSRHGTYLRTVELPRAAGRLVRAPRPCFDGTPIYTAAEDIRGERFYRDSKSCGSGPREER
jgi:hypothetical protein